MSSWLTEKDIHERNEFYNGIRSELERRDIRVSQEDLQLLDSANHEEVLQWVWDDNPPHQYIPACLLPHIHIDPEPPEIRALHRKDGES